MIRASFRLLNQGGGKEAVPELHQTVSSVFPYQAVTGKLTARSNTSYCLQPLDVLLKIVLKHVQVVI